MRLSRLVARGLEEQQVARTVRCDEPGEVEVSTAKARREVTWLAAEVQTRGDRSGREVRADDARGRPYAPELPIDIGHRRPILHDPVAQIPALARPIAQAMESSECEPPEEPLHALHRRLVAGHGDGAARGRTGQERPLERPGGKGERIGTLARPRTLAHARRDRPPRRTPRHRGRAIARASERARVGDHEHKRQHGLRERGPLAVEEFDVVVRDYVCAISTCRGARGHEGGDAAQDAPRCADPAPRGSVVHERPARPRHHVEHDFLGKQVTKALGRQRLEDGLELALRIDDERKCRKPLARAPSPSRPRRAGCTKRSCREPVSPMMSTWRVKHLARHLARGGKERAPFRDGETWASLPTRETRFGFAHGPTRSRRRRVSARRAESVHSISKSRR